MGNRPQGFSQVAERLAKQKGISFSSACSILGTRGGKKAGRIRKDRAEAKKSIARIHESPIFALVGFNPFKDWAPDNNPFIYSEIAHLNPDGSFRRIPRN